MCDCVRAQVCGRLKRVCTCVKRLVMLTRRLEESSMTAAELLMSPRAGERGRSMGLLKATQYTAVSAGSKQGTVHSAHAIVLPHIRVQ